MCSYQQPGVKLQAQFFFVQILVTAPDEGTPETKQTQALFSNKPSLIFLIIKYTIPVQSNYCVSFYCHCPVVSSWLSPAFPLNAQNELVFIQIEAFN